MYCRVTFKRNEDFYCREEGYNAALYRKCADDVISCLTDEEKQSLNINYTVSVPAERFFKFLDDNPWIIQFAEIVSDSYCGYLSSLVPDGNDPQYIVSEGLICYLIDKYHLPLFRWSNRNDVQQCIYFSSLLRDLKDKNERYYGTELSISL